MTGEDIVDRLKRSSNQSYRVGAYGSRHGPTRARALLVARASEGDAPP